MKVSHIPPFGVRMPHELKAKIEEAAKLAGRSINSEIVYRLQQSFTLDNQPKQITLKRKKKTSSLPNHTELSDEEQSEFNSIMLQLMDLMSKARDRRDGDLK